MRIQGETDSFGSELIDLCAACRARDEEESKNARERGCEWCEKAGREKTGLVLPARDPDEGLCGPLYHVCDGCYERLHARDDRDDDYDEYVDYDAGDVEYGCRRCGDILDNRDGDLCDKCGDAEDEAADAAQEQELYRSERARERALDAGEEPATL
jgi:hypothetical protein